MLINMFGGKCVFIHFTQFLFELSVFLLLNFKSTLYIWMQVFYQIGVFKIFLLVCRLVACLFFLLTVSTAEDFLFVCFLFLILMKFNLENLQVFLFSVPFCLSLIKFW